MGNGDTVLRIVREVSGELHAEAALHPTNNVPGTQWIGGKVGPSLLTLSGIEFGFFFPAAPTLVSRICESIVSQ